MTQLSLDCISEARNFLKRRIRTTPIEFSPKLTKILEVPVFLKLECMQITGSFKLRGAYYRLSKLTPEEKQKGIITCSAGNHGKAIAYVSSQMGIEASVYVPRHVDESKLEGIQSYGAHVILTPASGYDEAEELALKIANEQNVPFISAFDDPLIMAGNGGTLMAEIHEQLSDLKSILVPIGGGGLCAGLSYYIKELLPEVLIYGCQHVKSPTLQLSLDKGEAVTQLAAIETVAGGIEGGIGAQCFEIIRSRIHGVCLVSEAEIIEAFRWCLQNHQVLIEPSSAVVIAAILSNKVNAIKGPIVLVLTGRNVSFTTIRKLITY